MLLTIIFSFMFFALSLSPSPCSWLEAMKTTLQLYVNDRLNAKYIIISKFLSSTGLELEKESTSQLDSSGC